MELVTLGIMKLIESTGKDVDKDKDGENVPKLKSVEVVLVRFNLVRNDYHHTTDYQSFVYFCSKQTIWTVNKYFNTFFNNNEHS